MNERRERREREREQDRQRENRFLSVAEPVEIPDRVFDSENGMRARSTTLNHADGSMSRVISIGVPSDHPFADPASMAGPTGLHNLRIGPIRLPRAPTFIIRVRGPRNGEGRGGATMPANIDGVGDNDSLPLQVRPGLNDDNEIDPVHLAFVD